MYLKTPKRYRKGRKVHLINLRWLWLYLLAPVIIIPAVLIWEHRGPISKAIAEWTARNVRINISQPTPTATIPAADLQQRFTSFVQAGEFTDAIEALRGLTDANPNSAEYFSLLTQLILFRGDPGDQGRAAAALKAAIGAINANPEVGSGWVMVAMALNSQIPPRPQEALSYLLRARDFNPEDPMTLAVMAETYLNLEQPTRAEAIADQAIEAAKAAPTLDVRALAYALVIKGNAVSLRDGREATRYYEEAWRVALSDPTIPVGFVAQWLQSVYLISSAQDDKQRMIDVLTQAAARDKDDPINPYLLGLAYVNVGDPERAQSAFERCRDLEPNQPKCLFRLGQAQFQKQNYTQAAELAQRAIDVGAKDARTLTLAGYAYALDNRCSQAVPILEQALAANPEPNVASQILDALRICGVNAPPPAPPTATPTP